MDHLDRWSNLPNGVLSDAPPVRGIRRAGGKIECQRCTRLVDDNRSDDDLAKGRMPSCPHCWVALAVDHERKVERLQGDTFQFPPGDDGLSSFRRQAKGASVLADPVCTTA